MRCSVETIVCALAIANGGASSITRSLRGCIAVAVPPARASSIDKPFAIRAPHDVARRVVGGRIVAARLRFLQRPATNLGEHLAVEIDHFQPAAEATEADEIGQRLVDAFAQDGTCRRG